MQDILAILIATLAAAFLAYRTWLKLAHRSGGSCGSCSNCGTNDSIKSRQLVTISPEMPHAESQRRRV
jgi:hypothetical protein